VGTGYKNEKNGFDIYVLHQWYFSSRPIHERSGSFPLDYRSPEPRNGDREMFYTFISLSASTITLFGCCKSSITDIPRGPHNGHLLLFRLLIDIHRMTVRDSKLIKDINTAITEDNHLLEKYSINIYTS